MKSKTSNSFKFHFEWQKYIVGLPDSIRIEVYDAVIEYAISGSVIELGLTSTAIFNAIKNDIDEDNAKSSLISKSRSDAGKKHKGNQYKMEQNGTNGTNVPKMEQMEQVFQSEKTDEHNYTDKEQVTKTENGTSVPTEEDGTLYINNNNININNLNIDNNNNITTNKRTSKVFHKPTVEQISEYCSQRGNGIDAQYFFDFYESKGWVVGKSPMKDWKAAVRTWEKKRTGKDLFSGGMNTGVILKEKPKYTEGW